MLATQMTLSCGLRVVAHPPAWLPIPGKINPGIKMSILDDKVNYLVVSYITKIHSLFNVTSILSTKKLLNQHATLQFTHSSCRFVAAGWLNCGNFFTGEKLAKPDSSSTIRIQSNKHYCIK